MQMETDIYVIRYGNLPCQFNRAVLQRPKYFADNARGKVYYVTSSGSEICQDIESNVEKIVVPFTMLRRYGIVGVSLWNMLATLYVLIMLRGISKSLIYTFHSDGFAAGGFLKLLKGKSVKLVCDMQHTPYYYLDAAKSKKISFAKKIIYYILGASHFWLAKMILPRADLVCAMSLDYANGFAEIFENNFGVKKGNLFPIANGTDINLANEVYQERVEIERCGTKLLYAGNLQAERLAYILNFFSAYQKFDSQAELILCGLINAEARAELKNVQCRRNVKHLGLLEHNELMRLYNDVDIVLVIIDTARRDHEYSHPGKLYEAMAMRKAVVASDFDLARKIIKDNENGFVLKGEDFEYVCGDIHKILSDNLSRKTIEGNAYNAVLPFDWVELNIKWFERVSALLS